MASETTVYNTRTVYDEAGGGLDDKTILYVKKLDWFGIFNIPQNTKSYEYTIESKPTNSEYYIGGGASWPCRNTGVEGLVFGADDVTDVKVIDATYVREWSGTSWGFNKFYLYSLNNVYFPAKVNGVFSTNNFKLYINNELRFEINSNKVNPGIWNRYRAFYAGPALTDYNENARYFLEDLIFKTE